MNGLIKPATVILGLLLIAGAAAAGEDAGVLEYSWLTDRRVSGQQTVSRSSSDEGEVVSIHFEYSDRGRGPDFDTSITVNGDGLPVRFAASGLNSTRATISERFALEEGVARWHSSVEQGERPVAGKAFYLPNNESPEVLAMLARVLLDQEDGAIPLLPDGEATIARVDQASVAQVGRSRSLVLYRLTGIDVDPFYLWLDESDELFAYARKHFSIIRTGWEQSIGVLNDRADAAMASYYEELTERLTQRLAPLTVITGVRIFDSVKGELSAPSTVFLWEGTISAIYPGESRLPEDAQVIHGEGRVLLPGLWDMHNHVKPGFLLNYLAFGVTNVRDMGNQHDRLQVLMRRVREGVLAGPDIVPMGFIDRQGAFAAPVGRLAGSLEEALAHIDFYARRGYRGIKIYSAIEPGWIEPMAAAARARDLPVMGHIPAFFAARDAILAGFSEITHVNQLLLAFLGGETLDTRGPERFLVPGLRTRDLDIEGEDVEAFLALMKEHDVAHDTTLAVILELFRNRPGELSPIFREVADHLPAAVRRKLVMSEGYNQGNEEVFDRSADVVLDLMRKLHEEGIPLLPGTDNLLPGMTLVRELIDYTEAGIPAAEALQLATIVPARRLGLEQRIGSIEVGKEARLFIVDGNPLEDITALYRVQQVIKGRQLFHAPELLRAQGITPFSPDSP